MSSTFPFSALLFLHKSIQKPLHGAKQGAVWGRGVEPRWLKGVRRASEQEVSLVQASESKRNEKDICVVVHGLTGMRRVSPLGRGYQCGVPSRVRMVSL